MAYLVCYDITDNTLRLKISKRLKKSGLTRIQKSVFLGEISENGMLNLSQKLSKNMNKKKGKKDNLVIIKIHKTALQEMRTLGNSFDPNLAFGLSDFIII